MRRGILFSPSTSIEYMKADDELCFDIAADSGHESTGSDDEFQICEICNSEEVNFFGSVKHF